MRLFCVAVVCLLAAALGGCATTSWHQTYALPEDLAARRPELLRLTLSDGTTLMVHHPDVRADSIVGLDADGTSRMAVATADVARIEIPRRHLTDEGRTARDVGIGVGVGAIVLLAVAALAFVALFESFTTTSR